MPALRKAEGDQVESARRGRAEGQASASRPGACTPRARPPGTPAALRLVGLQGRQRLERVENFPFVLLLQLWRSVDTRLGTVAGDASALHQGLDIICLERLVLNEPVGDAVKRVEVLLEELLGALVAAHDDFTHFLVNLSGCLLGIVWPRVEVPSEENLSLRSPEGQGAEFAAHAPAAHHGPCRLGGPLDVIGRARANLIEDEFL